MLFTCIVNKLRCTLSTNRLQCQRKYFALIGTKCCLVNVQLLFMSIISNRENTSLTKKKYACEESKRMKVCITVTLINCQFSRYRIF